MSEEPRQNPGRGLVDRKLVEAPSDFIAGRPKAALLFCHFLLVFCVFFLLFLFFILFLACFIVVVSVVSICFVCDFSIEATCPPVSATCFVFVVRSFPSYSWFLWWTEAEPGARVSWPQSTSSPPPACNFIVLLFWFFGDFRYGAPLFIVMA